MWTWTDSSHGGPKPQAGLVSTFADGAVSYSSYRSTLTGLSSCENEVAAATKAIPTACTNHNILRFFGIGKSDSTPPILCDNLAAVQLADGDANSKRLKHVATRVAFLQESVQEKKASIYHVGTSGQLADIMTKPLPAAQFHELRRHLVGNPTPEVN